MEESGELIVDFLLPDGTLWETIVFPPEKAQLIRLAAIALNVDVGEFIMNSLRQELDDYIEQKKLV